MDAALSQPLTIEPAISRTHQRWLIPLVLILAGIAALAIDIPVASLFKGKTLPESIDRPLREALENHETFGNGYGATVIIIAVAVLVPRSRRDLPWVISGSLGAGAVANLLKLAIHRTRPVHFDLSQGSVWSTFDRAMNNGNSMQSFPSSHTATAVGLALMLSALFPQGRWYFLTLACLVGAQRIVSSAHFPSDVLTGAAVGWIVGTACVSWMASTRHLFTTATKAE